MNEQPLQSPLNEIAAIPDIWRDEVQARLERYKRRRGRRIEGAFTMRFPFPPAEAAAAAEDQPDSEQARRFNPAVTDESFATEKAEGAPIALEVSEAVAESGMMEEKADAVSPSIAEAVASSAPVKEPVPEDEPVRLVDLRPRPVPRRKVIAFPSPPHVQREYSRGIADPVQPEQLRILDVPEELQAIPATSFLQGLLDAPAAAPVDVRSDGVELPCATMRASRRIGAACIDAVATLAGVGLFAAAAARFLPELPPMKFLIAGVAAVAVLLWTSYQYLFLVYGGRTPGMAATHMYLRTFKGRFPNFRQRQLRVVGLYVSVLSLGMGVLWFLVDVESLCWHDRISQTFPVATEQS